MDNSGTPDPSSPLLNLNVPETNLELPNPLMEQPHSQDYPEFHNNTSITEPQTSCEPVPVPVPSELIGVKSGLEEEESTGNMNSEEDSKWETDNDESMSLSSSSEDEEEEDEEWTFPPVLPATSVLAMTQSVGCNVQNSVASALGKMVMKKLRHVLLVASQFRKHQRTKGLRTEHFKEAESLVNTPSYGQKYSGEYALANRVGSNLSVVHDPTEVCLHSSIQTARQKLNKVPLNPHTIHSLRTYRKHRKQIPTKSGISKPAESNKQSSEDWFSEESDVSEPEPFSELNKKGSEEAEEGSAPSPQPKPPAEHLSDLRKRALEDNEELLANKIMYAELVEHVENLLLVAQDDVSQDSPSPSSPSGSQTSQPIKPDTSEFGGTEIGIEWIDYMKIFVDTFLPNSGRTINLLVPMDPNPPKIPNDSTNPEPGNKSEKTEKDEEEIPRISLNQPKDFSKAIGEDDDFDEMGRRNFEAFLADIRSYGIEPVLGVVIDFFHDYLKGRFGTPSSSGHERILLVLHAVLSCQNSQVDTRKKEEIMELIVQIIAMNPPVKSHPRIVSVILLMFERGTEDFWIDLIVWICRYVSQSLRWFVVSCLHNVHDRANSFNLAISLANALELYGISFAYELDWHGYILDFIEGSRFLRSRLLEDSETSSTVPQPHQVPSDQQEGENSEKEDEWDTISEETEDEGVDPNVHHYFNTKPNYSELREHEIQVLDTFSAIEENILVFLRNFLTNYKERTSAELIYTIHKVASAEYGERMTPYLSPHQVFQPFQKRRPKSVLGYERVGKKLRDELWRTRFTSLSKYKA